MIKQQLDTIQYKTIETQILDYLPSAKISSLFKEKIFNDIIFNLSISFPIDSDILWVHSSSVDLEKLILETKLEIEQTKLDFSKILSENSYTSNFITKQIFANPAFSLRYSYYIVNLEYIGDPSQPMDAINEFRKKTTPYTNTSNLLYT